MEREELAALLVETDDVERAALFDANRNLADIATAYALKDICFDAWTAEPARAKGAAAALNLLSIRFDNQEIQALAAWVSAIASLIDGQMERAVAHLDDAHARFVLANKPHRAAETQVSKLLALAILGRYDEAKECGLRAREFFMAEDDQLVAGKIEHNLANISIRRERYTESEELLRSARQRFIAIDDQRQIAMIENNLAFVLAQQNRFREAEDLYREGLARAESCGLRVTQAEIEASIGNLQMFEGHYDRALDWLERSRRKFSSLAMPHETAKAELELADAYLDLNLAKEAIAIYSRVVPTFADLSMRAEEARARANQGRALAMTGESDCAIESLGLARDLFRAEENVVGEAIVSLATANLARTVGNLTTAIDLARDAEGVFEKFGLVSRLQFARWLRGDCEAASGNSEVARGLLTAALAAVREHALPQVSLRCLTSLGLLDEAEGDFSGARRCFQEAIEILEELRAPLPADEFRTAFVADKLIPFESMVRLCLNDGSPLRVEEAFEFVERGRARALLDMVSDVPELRFRPCDKFEESLVGELDSLREDLNWFYSRINRPQPGDTSQSIRSLQEEATTREQRAQEITRQLNQRTDRSERHTDDFDLGELKANLGSNAALIEFASLGDEIIAFALDDDGLRVHRNLGTIATAQRAINQFRFQISTLRFGAGRMSEHMPQLATRARQHLATLFDQLMRPIIERTRARKLVIVPHQALHYVPFHALHDGAQYLIERFEISYAPSAGVLNRCLSMSPPVLRRAAILGMADEQTPRVRDEIDSIAPLFDEAVVLVDDAATIQALRECAPDADVIHLACHGQFRPDNPLFSSLRLSDGWFTARDAYSLALSGSLVTLSACETGVSEIAPGDELMGLVRGFLSAGASTLLMSLWTVDDESTAELMKEFYGGLAGQLSPAAALRQAQLRMLESKPHPYFWSPFVLVGRW